MKFFDKFAFVFVINMVLLPWVYGSDMEVSTQDIHTQSNFLDVAVRHMSMQLSLDMDRKFFSGYVDLHIENRHQKMQLILDTKDLRIQNAYLDPVEGGRGTLTEFSHGLSDRVRGDALTVVIKTNTKIVRIYYETTKEAAGLDWIDKTLTDDQSPMVVTQFQAINARTFVPCQDTPAQKITYDASIVLANDSDQNISVLMAVPERKIIRPGVFFFNMPIPIPTYLIALAAGVFHEIRISKRISVFAPQKIVKSAAEEFADVESMVAKAESLLGPYQWERFDIFIMPDSFSYGGMENPTMTFIGRTVLARDKSLVNVIVHELAHSWAGNWVTNRTWDDFWLNEGTTTYLERLLMAVLYGKEVRNLQMALGQQALRDNIDLISRTQGKQFTRLKLNMPADFHPDDAVSHVPYEKGANFWLALEQACGLENVVDFLKQYFNTFAKGVITTERLKQELLAFPAFEGCNKVDLDDWFYGEGLPQAGLPEVKSQYIKDVEDAVKEFSAPEYVLRASSPLKVFISKQWSYFFKLLKKLPPAQILSLNNEFRITEKNDEIKSNFFELVIRSGIYKKFEDHIDKYLATVGRIKYVSPLYQALIETNQKNIALGLFEKHKGHNNAITNGSIERQIGIQAGN